MTAERHDLTLRPITGREELGLFTRLPYVLNADQGVPRIRASTDLGNVPMANAFRRAGYGNFRREINMTW